MSVISNRSRVIIGEWDELCYSEKKLVVDTDMSVKVGFTTSVYNFSGNSLLYALMTYAVRPASE